MDVREMRQSIIFCGHIHRQMYGLALPGFLLCGAIAVYGSNILVIVPTASYSHQVFYRAYTLGLQKRGHNLTIITADPINDPTLKNYREIDVGYTYKHFKKLIDFSSDSGKINRLFSEVTFFLFWKVINDTCHMELSDPNVIDIYKRNEKFDVVVLEWGMYSCFNPFGKLSDWKMIGISSFESGAITQIPLGGWWNPSFVPDPSLQYSDHMNFLQRVRSTVFFWNWFLFTRFFRWYETKIARMYFGSDIETTLDMEAKVALVMDNNHFTMSYPRAVSANVVHIGGPAFHLNEIKPKPLPKDLQEFMDDAPHGVIYFSLGTNVKTSNMPSREEKHLVETFRRLKQKIVWKWENENLEMNLKNVYKRKWFPQIDVLAHPNVKAFVTQGGLQSVGEAVHFNVPMVVFPFFADQGHNARKMELEGAAIVLEIDHLNSDMFTDALNKILYNKTYKENIVRLSTLVKDQPMPPLEKAIWWTEYVIRHNGAPHLKSAAAAMPWYQYFLLDVLAFLLAAIFIILYILYRICKFLARLAFPSKFKKD